MTATICEQPRIRHRATPPQATAAPVVFYHGDRIDFRPVETEDEPLLRRFINNPANRQYLHRIAPTNGIRERDWIDSLGKDDKSYTFGIVVKDGDRLIGTCGLYNIHWTDHKAMFGICIGDTEYQSQGYGTEAVKLTLRFGFEELNLNRIGLVVLSHNLRGIQCYQKAGFVHEGCLRQANYSGGQYRDGYLFGILRDEWLAGHGR